MKIGRILLIAAGCFGGLLLAVGSVGAIFYCIRHRQIKNKSVVKVSAKKNKKVPAHVAIKVNSPALKTKSHLAVRKRRARNNAITEEQCNSAKSNRL